MLQRFFIVQSVLFLTRAPLNSKVQIPLQSLALREIMSQFIWDLVLREFRWAPVKKKHPVCDQDY